MSAREKEETQQARALAEGLSSIVSRKGKIVEFSEYQGAGTLKIGTPGEGLLGSGSSASATLAAGRTNREETNYNLYYNLIRRIQDTARLKATDATGHFDKDKYNQLYTQSLYDLYNGTNELAKGKSEFSFGQSGLVGEAWESIFPKSSEENNKGFNMEDYRRDVFNKKGITGD